MTPLQKLQKIGKIQINGTQFICLAFSPPGSSLISSRGHWSIGRLKEGRWDGPISNSATLVKAIDKFFQDNT